MNGEQLIKIAESGLGLTSGGDEMRLLNILLNIEDILDKGRGLVEPGQSVSEINTLMDELRKRIRSLLGDMDSNAARQFLDERGERLKRQFSV